MRKTDKIFLVIGSAALVATAAIGGGLLFFSGDSSTPATTSSSQQTTSTQTESTTDSSDSSTTSESSSYADGTYTATLTYAVPRGGQNSLDVSLTIADGSITTASTNNATHDSESERYIGGFEDSLSADAVGQSLANYSPDRIGGASLTTAAFAEALDTIRSDAQA